MAETLRMNFRVSFILLVLVAVVGGYVLIFELQRQPEKSPREPWFYDIGYDDIVNISVTYGGQRRLSSKRSRHGSLKIPRSQ